MGWYDNHARKMKVSDALVGVALKFTTECKRLFLSCAMRYIKVRLITEDTGQIFQH